MNNNRKIWENPNTDFLEKRALSLALAVVGLVGLLFWFLIGVDTPKEDLTDMRWIYQFSLVAFLVGGGLSVIFHLLHKKQQEWLRQEANKQAARERKEAAERRRKESICPVCKKENALVKEQHCIDHRLVGVRDDYDAYFNFRYEIEDYEDTYLTTIKCRFCDYYQEWKNRERVSFRNRV